MHQNFMFTEGEDYAVQTTAEGESFQTLRFDEMQGATYLFFTWNTKTRMDVSDSFIKDTIYAFSQAYTDHMYSPQMLQYIGTTIQDREGNRFLQFIKPTSGGRKRRRTKRRRTRRRRKQSNRRRRM